MKDKTREELRSARELRDRTIAVAKKNANMRLVETARRIMQRDGLNQEQAAEGVGLTRQQLFENIAKSTREDS